MPANTQQSSATTAHVLAVAASHYAEAKSRADDDSQLAWQKLIYNLVASKQHTLV